MRLIRITYFKKTLFLLYYILLISSSVIYAQTPPVIVAGSIINAVPGTSSIPIPISVTGFTNISKFNFTMKFDTTKVRYTSAITNSTLTGMTVTYTRPTSLSTEGKLVFAWTGVANISLIDGTDIANLTFSYVTSTGILGWAYTYGAICKIYTLVGATQTALDDTPKDVYYKNGGISNRSALVTTAPIISNPSVGTVLVPITATGFTDIGAMTLNFEYDPTILTFVSYTKNPAFNSSFVLGDNLGTGGKRKITIQWYGTAFSLANGSTLCTVNFNYLAAGTSCALKWTDNGGSCEYADGAGNILVDMPTATYYKNGSLGIPLLSVFLRKGSNCGEFNVNLKSPQNLQSNLTKIIFTIRWAATAGSDVQLKDIVSNWSGLQQLGNRELYGGYYYVTFQSLTSYAVNFLANTENTIMTFRHNGIGDGSADFTIIASDYNTIYPALNTAWYIEVNSITATGSITNDANSVSLNCGIYLKDFLQGPYNSSTHLMDTVLSFRNYIPLTHPYNVTPWFYAGLEHIHTYPKGIVDWVLVELRTGTVANTILERRVALIKKDGSIVDTNGTSAVIFKNFIPGNSYYVVVYHRSHIPVMTANAISLPNTLATKHDFTINPSTNVYSTTNDGVILLETGVYGQIAGDVYTDNQIKYSGSDNDNGYIMAKINSIANPPVYFSSTISGYYAEDVNMDGVVKYSGSQNDQSVIISNIDFLTNPTYLNSVYSGQVSVSSSLKSSIDIFKDIKRKEYLFIKPYLLYFKKR